MNEVWKEVKYPKMLWWWICSISFTLSAILFAFPNIHIAIPIGLLFGWWGFIAWVWVGIAAEDSLFLFDKYFRSIKKQVPNGLEIWYKEIRVFYRGENGTVENWTWTSGDGFLIRNPVNDVKVIINPSEFSGRFENIRTLLANKKELWQ